MKTYSPKPQHIERRWYVDRRQRPGSRTPGLGGRRHPARQAQADLRAAHGHRRPRDRDQRGADRADRRQGNQEDLVPPLRLSRRHHGDPVRPLLRRAPDWVVEKAVRGHAPEEQLGALHDSRSCTWSRAPSTRTRPSSRCRTRSASRPSGRACPRSSPDRRGGRPRRRPRRRLTSPRRRSPPPSRRPPPRARRSRGEEVRRQEAGGTQAHGVDREEDDREDHRQEDDREDHRQEDHRSQAHRQEERRGVVSGHHRREDHHRTPQGSRGPRTAHPRHRELRHQRPVAGRLLPDARASHGRGLALCGSSDARRTST